MLNNTLRLQAGSCGRFSMHVVLGITLLTSGLCGCTGVRAPIISEPTLPAELLGEDETTEPLRASEPEPETAQVEEIQTAPATDRPDADFSIDPEIIAHLKADHGSTDVELLEHILIVYQNPAAEKPADRIIIDGWHQKPASSNAPFGIDRTPRWINHGLRAWHELKKSEVMKGSPPLKEVLPLERALLSRKKYVATTSAIELARNLQVRRDEELTSSATLNDKLSDKYRLRMRQIIRGDGTTVPQRRAAIEALGFMQDGEFLQSVVTRQRSILAERVEISSSDNKEEVKKQQKRREVAALLFEEALLALAACNQTEPSDIVFALKLPVPEIQTAALTIITHQDIPFPHEAVPLVVSGRTGRVRTAALRAVARRKHHAALEAVERAGAGADQTIRQEAIATLGALGTEEAIEILRKIYGGSSESLSSGAVEALAHAGDWLTVQTAATHKASRIRAQAARSLGQAEAQMAAPLLDRLLHDKNIDVRTAAIAGASQLPTPSAGPLLLTALDSAAPRTRLEAFQELARIWPTAADTGIDQFAGEHKVVAPRLQQQWEKEHPDATADNGNHQPASYQQAATGANDSSAPSENLLRDLSLWMKWSTMTDPKLRELGEQRLKQLGDKLPSHLHTLIEQQQRPVEEVVPGSVFARILPVVNEDFATIEQLGSDLTSIRRLAAKDLALRASVRPLPAIAAGRILHYMRPVDPVEIQLNLVRATHGQAAGAPILERALRSESIAVQKAACEEIAESGSPRFVPHLIPLLESVEPTILTTAITALGHCGPLEDLTPLRDLLRHRNPLTGVAAAAALLQMNDDDGAAALERFSLHDEKNVRRQAVIAMGQSKDEQFRSALLQRLNDETSVRETALQALPQITGVDPSTGAANTIERIAAWKAWAARQ